MKGKNAVITFELVDESTMEANEKIARELAAWLQEDVVFIPWVKEVLDIRIKTVKGLKGTSSEPKENQSTRTP
ncbi:MAG: hypothetical protein QXH37_01230 [Candidatus Bathyarchaeia archaeon]